MAGLSTGNGLLNVVVTGAAMSTALATDAESTWKKLLDGANSLANLALNTLTNYFNVMAHVDNDWPVVSL